MLPPEMSVTTQPHQDLEEAEKLWSKRTGESRQFRY